MLRGGDDCYKVGIAKDVRKRVANIQTSNANLIEVVTAKLVNDAEALERAVHAYLSQHKAKGGTEWFRLSEHEAIEVAIIIHRYPDAIQATDITTYEALDDNRKLYRLIDAKLNALLSAASKPAEFDEKPPASIAQAIEDEMLHESAVQAFKAEGRASVSLLQRELKIGYGRAFRIMGDLQRAGIVERVDGSQNFKWALAA